MNLLKGWENRKRLMNYVIRFSIVTTVLIFVWMVNQVVNMKTVITEKDKEILAWKERSINLAEMSGELYFLCENRFKYTVQNNLQKAYEFLDQEENLYKKFQEEVRK